MGSVEKIARPVASASTMSFLVFVLSYLAAAILTIGAWFLCAWGHGWAVENLELLADIAAWTVAGAFFFFCQGFVKAAIEDWLGPRGNRGS
jgi:hypothetical protein